MSLFAAPVTGTIPAAAATLGLGGAAPALYTAPPSVPPPVKAPVAFSQCPDPLTCATFAARATRHARSYATFEATAGTAMPTAVESWSTTSVALGATWRAA